LPVTQLLTCKKREQRHEKTNRAKILAASDVTAKVENHPLISIRYHPS